MLHGVAVVFEGPRNLTLRTLPLGERASGEVVVEVEWSSISTGTERLLYTGEMPPFPGMGYPLVPGYETVGRVVEAELDGALQPGDRVFVPGASCYGEVRGLFGGASSRLRVPAARVTRIDETLGESGVMLALAATARHALATGDALPDLIVGHGTLGRLLARIAVAMGGAPRVWEKNPARMGGAVGYEVVAPEADERRDYGCVMDASGDASLVEPLLMRLRKGGELVLAGFYTAPVSFAFPIAFMREARIRVAAEWQPPDMEAVLGHVQAGELDLSRLITHRKSFEDASEAYDTAFENPDCLKMVLDWRSE